MGKFGLRSRGPTFPTKVRRRGPGVCVYLGDGIGKYEEQLKQLGPRTTGLVCLYIKDLEKIDLAVLEAMVTESYRTLTADTYGLRAREGGRKSSDDPDAPDPSSSATVQ